MNNDLCRVIISSNPSCHCGAHFECSRYLIIRTALFNNLNWFPADCNVVSRLLACGNDKLTYDQNVDIFNYVFEYTRKSNRFLNA
jgi:hypothetical protein